MSAVFHWVKDFSFGPGRLRNDFPSVVHGDNSAGGPDALPSISQRAPGPLSLRSVKPKPSLVLLLVLLHKGGTGVGWVTATPF
ncbi:hypothetical protein CORC01_11112 [Colletotrichum orchidophilum]|uniref:Uncharacterized protein n=1 Tax=Colletotrichum orchidophilum TaxID=1209926 RepID=A0A1G4AWZ7_9PEZI|nr:uncharacterized protein CORC01_11112 [Colletotrichum orchidophilum]OHE93613.1 hypothetical protein CORC01_11112 [Colletotrichum orchidophilum]